MSMTPETPTGIPGARTATSRELLSVLFRGKWLILGLLIVTTLTVVSLSATTPVSFASSGRVQLMRGERQSALSPNRQIFSDWEEAMSGELEAAKSVPVLQRAREILAEEARQGAPAVSLDVGSIDAGAQVTHVDASKKSVGWARENQALSGLNEKPIRWIVEDAVKYVQREDKRGMKYDGIILDPPKFGRGPKGEVWEVYKSLPSLLDMCRACLSDNPLFVIVTVYAVRASAIHIAQAMDEMMKKYKGNIDSGELVTRETSANRLLSQAVYARRSSK